jgi:hypothetical protein
VCEFSLKPFSKGLAEPPSAAVARRNERNSPIGVFFENMNFNSDSLLAGSGVRQVVFEQVYLHAEFPAPAVTKESGKRFKGNKI